MALSTTGLHQHWGEGGGALVETADEDEFTAVDDGK